MPPTLPAALLCLLGALAFPAVALADSGVGPVDPSSPGAEGIADIYWFILAFAGGIFVVVFVPLVFFTIRFRSRGRPREVEGPEIHGATRLELAWTAIPVLILVGIAAFVFYKLPGITDPAEAGQPQNAVRVEGRQFYWQFEYPNGVLSVSRLLLPAGRVTKIQMTAPEHDVIHSFWVPTLHGKLDVLPGDTTSLKVRPDRPGRHRIVCGEFCGIQHAAMLGQVEVVSADEFERWLEEQRREQQRPSAELGRATFEAACETCHGPKGAGLIGPPLAGNPIVQQAEAVETVVREGRGAMPAIGEGWSDVQMRSLLRYMRSELGGEGGDAGGGEG